jgi:hypothetical protein
LLAPRSYARTSSCTDNWTSISCPEIRTLIPTTLTAEPLTDAEIADLVANLRSAPLGAGGRVRISLAGVQEKLLLTRMPG